MDRGRLQSMGLKRVGHNWVTNTLGFPHSSVGKESACNAGDPGSILGSGKFPGEGNGNPFHYSCLENLRDRGAWQAPVHAVVKVGHDLATKPPPSQISSYWVFSSHPLTHELASSHGLFINYHSNREKPGSHHLSPTYLIVQLHYICSDIRIVNLCFDGK